MEVLVGLTFGFGGLLELRGKPPMRVMQYIREDVRCASPCGDARAEKPVSLWAGFFYLSGAADQVERNLWD